MKRNKKRARVARGTEKTKKIEAAPAQHFTEEEEAFFQAGLAMATIAVAPPETFDDIAPAPRQSWWRRLLGEPQRSFA